MSGAALPEPLRCAALEPVPHGFFGRSGGVSQGVLAGLNCGPGSGDDSRLVEANRALAIAAVLPGGLLATIHQIHSAEAVAARASWPDGERPRADALVSDRPGLLLGILTADCAPVLLADHRAGVVGAAHAGWRGALAGVTDRAIAAMERLGASAGRIVATVGPCIARVSYEVDEDFRTRFLAADRDNARFFDATAGTRPHFDLGAYVVARLEAAGIGRARSLAVDTYADERGYYSYRRSVHRGEPAYGRQLSLIGLAPEGGR